MRFTRAWATKLQVALFLAIAFGVSWCIWPLVLANPASSPLIPFGPGVAAVVVCAWAGGRRLVAQLLARLVRFAVHPAWYLVALAIPAIATGGALAAVAVAGGPAPSWETADLPQLVFAVAATVVIVGVFEELGWRGYLLPRLERRRPAVAAALIVGLIWFPWHLPELVSDPSQRPLLQFGVLVMSQSVIFAWLYNSTRGSLPVVMLCHAAYNTFARFYLADLADGLYLLAWSALSALTLTLAALVIWYAGARDLNHAKRRSPRQGAGQNATNPQTTGHPDRHSA